MGLFRRKDNFMKEMLKERKAAEKSFNYQIIFNVIQNIYFDINFEKLFNNNQNTKNFLNIAYRFVVEKIGLKHDERFKSLEFCFCENDKKEQAIVIKFIGPWTVETECNFIALCQNNSGNKYICTSEYYKLDSKFCLCKIFGNGRRMSFGNEITTLDSFLNAIDQKIL